MQTTQFQLSLFHYFLVEQYNLLLMIEHMVEKIKLEDAPNFEAVFSFSAFPDQLWTTSSLVPGICGPVS